jgi:hypothetical protein
MAIGLVSYKAHYKAQWLSGTQQGAAAKRQGTGDFAQFATGGDVAVADAGVKHAIDTG